MYLVSSGLPFPSLLTILGKNTHTCQKKVPLKSMRGEFFHRQTYIRNFTEMKHFVAKCSQLFFIMSFAIHLCGHLSSFLVFSTTTSGGKHWPFRYIILTNRLFSKVGKLKQIDTSHRSVSFARTFKINYTFFSTNENT